jgi:hypothetical protein
MPAMRRVPLLACLACVASCSSPAPVPKAPTTAPGSPVLAPAPGPERPPDLPEVVAIPRLEPVADATCVVVEAGTSYSDVQLRFHGVRFAVIDGPATYEFRGTKHAATMHVVTDELDLTGEVQVTELSMRPREPRLQDGWFEIRLAPVASIDGDKASLDPYVPSWLQLENDAPRTFACANLALSERPRDGAKLPRRELRAGRKIELRREPEEAAFGAIELPKRNKRTVTLGGHETVIEDFVEREVGVMKKRGAWSKIRFDAGSIAIEAWVKSRDLVKTGSGFASVMGSFRDKGPEAPPIACPGAVPVFVRYANHVAEVGVVRPGGPIRRHAPDDTGDEVPIFLGGYKASFRGDAAEPDLQPFVRRADLADCGELLAP